MSRVLLLVAHGSRHASAKAEIRQLTAALEASLGAHFHVVSCAFLDLDAPRLGDALDALLAAGHGEIWVLPYFLVAGRHIEQDIPAIIAEKIRQHPAASLRLLSHVGAAEGMLALLLSVIALDHGEGPSPASGG